MPFTVLQALKGCMQNGVAHLMTQYTLEKHISLFWKRINKNGSVPTHMPHLGKCWEWTGCLINGYGTVSIKRKTYRTHRLSWILVYGNIPDGLWVLHKCDNRKCVNPSHLFLGTQKNNIDDRIEKGRSIYVKGEAQGGHKLTTNQVIEIRDRYANGDISQSQLGKEYHVDRSSIGLIVNNKIWKDIAK